MQKWKVNIHEKSQIPSIDFMFVDHDNIHYSNDLYGETIVLQCSSSSQLSFSFIIR